MARSTLGMVAAHLRTPGTPREIVADCAALLCLVALYVAIALWLVALR